MVKNISEAVSLLKKAYPNSKIFKYYEGNLGDDYFYAFLLTGEKDPIQEMFMVNKTTGDSNFVDGIMVRPFQMILKEVNRDE